MSDGIVDAHHHLELGSTYVDELLRECDRLDIEHVCISGLGSAFGMADNAAVEVAVRAHPDRLVGFRYIRLGLHPLQDVDLAVEGGCRGLKFTLPLRAYDHESYLPYYERAQRYGLPCLFHTGIVTTKSYLSGISSRLMRPSHLDTIAHQFPRLSLICAHLGMPWHEEAAAIARILPNVYVDLSGAPAGWRVQWTATAFRELFYREDMWAKVVWGSDVPWWDVGAALARDQHLAEELALSSAQRRALFGGTISALLPT